MGSNSQYQQHKHRRITGFVEATRAAKCMHCGGLVPRGDIFKGWCATCISNWGATADRGLLDSARFAYANRLISTDIADPQRPPTAQAYERLKNRIAERRPDEWFIPMTLYVGNYTIGQAQANWNYLQALYELEVMTTAQAFKIGRESFDLLHICGRHAPMQSSSLGAFIGRVVNSPDVWATLEPRVKEYIQDFIAEQGIGFRCLVSPRRRISAISTDHHHVRRSYRRDPHYQSATERRLKKREWDAKYSGVIQPTANFWPFAVKQAPTEHDMLHAIDRATRGIPEQWRQDVCQDLVVAVLSGETTLENLRDAIPKHVSGVFKMHPIKYGHASLDAPVGHINGYGSRTLGDLLAAVEQEDREEQAATDAAPDRCGWHEGFDRPVGLASVAEVAFTK